MHNVVLLHAQHGVGHVDGVVRGVLDEAARRLRGSVFF